MKRWLLTAILLAAGCGESTTTRPADAEPPPQKLPTTQVSLGGKPFNLEVADEPDERQTGLMHRRQMAADAGMIFVFPSSQKRSFWMRETHIPLDIIYLSTDGRIVSVKSMKPLDLTSVPSDGAAQFAIELNLGVADALGLKPGQTIDLPADLKTAGR